MEQWLKLTCGKENNSGLSDSDHFKIMVTKAGFLSLHK